MLYTPRTIALWCELHHPPLLPDPAPIQRLHNEMFQSGDPAYSSFSVTPAGAILSNPVAQPGASSFVAFLPDRFQFREELSSLTFDGFARRVREISARVAALRGLQVFTAQTVTVRTLVNPRNFRDSRAYLRQGMFGFEDEVQAFGREPRIYGMRLVFPPDEQHPNAFSLRIESYSSDPRSLYLENQASFGPLVADPVLQPIEDNVLATYRFVVEETLRFVSRFDAPIEQAGGGGA
jgi:hypothetical protein